MLAFWIVLATVLPGDTSGNVDFDRDIIPVLTKAGCNTGACHGAAVGRGGFKLSLYGGDPQADYRSMVHELEGRRVNLARPDESLVVMKPTESMEHGGGYRLDPSGEGATRLTDWIRQGARRDAGSTAKLVRVNVSPSTHVAVATDERISLSAVAHFSDGSQRDVTKWTVFTPEDETSVEVDSDSAVATVRRRGRHIVVARYLSQVVPVEIMLPLADDPIHLVDVSGSDFIDREIAAVLQTLRIPTSPACDDPTFLRRISLDLTGRLPTAQQVKQFSMPAGSTDDAADRRRKLVDRLLRSEEFNQYWTMRLAKLFRVRSQPRDTQGAVTFHRWLGQQVSEGVGYDVIAREVLTAVGDTHQIGPANFYRTVAGPREQAEFASELFMANRLRCANCHNHPLDQWTQDDYHGLAAIFAKVRSERVVAFKPGGEVSHPKTGESAVPRIPGQVFLSSEGDCREQLADWLTDRENPFFAKAIVNRLWKAMMGRGLVEPTDDMRATNPATHPALLNQLADDFVEHGYDLRHTLRQIALSQTYGRSAHASKANAADDRFYSHAYRKPLEPEVLADAISDVLGVSERYGQQPAGTRAVMLFDPKIESRSLDILGRCSREETCETPAGMAAGGLPLKLHLLNGGLLNHRIADSSGRLMRMMESSRQPNQIVKEFYAAALSRYPTEREANFWQQQWKPATSQEQQREVLEDFVWSLLTCNEFMNNH